MRKHFVLLLAVILTVLLVTSGCSSSNQYGGNENTAASTSDSKLSEGQTVAAKNEVAERAEGDAGEANTSGGGEGGSIGNIAPAASSSETGFSQKLIYKASLTMEVGDYDKAVTELRNAIHQSGGYILQFQDEQYKYEKGSTYTIKVPSGNFTSFIDRLDGMEHKRFERQIGATDVTEEYVDLESRLKAKLVVEERLLGFMDQAQKADDLVKFSQQLSTVQEEIERIKGRIRYLDRGVAFSTVELRLYQTSEHAYDAKPTLGKRMSKTLSASVDTMVNVLQGLMIFIAGALPVVVFLAILASPVIWLVRRNSKSKPARPVSVQKEKINGIQNDKEAGPPDDRNDIS
ncbi:DUF4349 domain-containing protein [Paenibacillus sp. NPDC058071]|uniref:DUF4349 domain-containing protein n=1 Tax=Paenibacillus sp. NPDC058071 TaxID=3346326 RepID=UPI0036DA2886